MEYWLSQFLKVIFEILIFSNDEDRTEYTCEDEIRFRE